MVWHYRADLVAHGLDMNVDNDRHVELAARGRTGSNPAIPSSFFLSQKLDGTSTSVLPPTV
jgi:hypothetical protein